MTMHETTIVNAETFHRERSLMLDACAALEQAVIALLRRSGAKITGDPLGHKVTTLKNAKAGPQYPHATKAKVDSLLADVESLLVVRADIVHAHLKLARIDKTTLACFTNSRELGELAPAARLVTLESLGQLTKQFGKIAKDLAAA